MWVPGWRGYGHGFDGFSSEDGGPPYASRSTPGTTAEDEMGFKQRERKRKQKAAAMQAAKESSRADLRRPGGEPLAAGRRGALADSTKWWLTPVEQTTCCARHGGVLRPGQDMVYRHTPREALCVACADREGIKYRPSRRWERAKQVKARRSPTWMREPVGIKRIEERR